MDARKKHRQYRRITESMKTEFLASVAEGNTVSYAASQIRSARSALYALRDRDEDFARAWQAAEEDGVQALEQEAKRRAIEKSDTLLIFLLKAKRPETYGDTARLRRRVPVAREFEDELPTDGEGIDRALAEAGLAVVDLDDEASWPAVLIERMEQARLEGMTRAPLRASGEPG
jgi:hypothetical protein